jgi:bifunctional enzyme CysN/CysC
MATTEIKSGQQSLRQSEARREKDLLRFITCGSVDDGKSTLIGRLLWDSKLVLEDQRRQLEAESRAIGRVPDGEIDFSLLVDGLSAEREQGITIDVAYRFFQTGIRKFIVADTPGHEQYTRNMATGASTAELALILVDARQGILIQTRRHATIVSLMGIRHLVLVVNKMDLVAWDQTRFKEIEKEFRGIAKALGFEQVTCIPVSALTGENVRNAGEHLAWFQGKTLMEFLETVDVTHEVASEFRFPVQWVNRPNPEFRGFSGTLRGGEVAVGDSIIAMPSGKQAAISRIVTMGGDMPVAHTGDAVTLVLDQEIDVSRGDILIKADDENLSVADQLQAHLIWVGGETLLTGRQYLVRMGTATSPGKIITVKHRVDIETQAKTSAKALALNDVGVVTLALDRPLPFDAYDRNRETGSFVLIDLYDNTTVAAGMIMYPLRRSTNVMWHKSVIDKAVRARSKGQNPACVWFTGLSGSGKSTIANLIEKRLAAEGRHTFILDADNVRHGLNSDLGFTEVDRIENVRRMAEVAKLMVDAGLIVMVCAISPYRKDRDMARQIFDVGEFVEVFVDTPVEECEIRDPKGLYKKARSGEIPNFTGISAPYERPSDPEVHLDGTDPAEDLVDRVLAICKF